MILLIYSALVRPNAVLGLDLGSPGTEIRGHSGTSWSGSHKDGDGLEHFSYEEMLGEL